MKSLADVLREQLLLTGCKICCDEGHCGSCTVLVDGKQLGTTPTEIAVFPCSNYRLMLEKSGFQAASIEVGPATVPVSAMVMPWYVALPPIGFPAYCALSAFTPNVVTASLKLAAGPPAPAK